MIRLRFDAGSLLLDGVPELPVCLQNLPWQQDPRVGAFRIFGCFYAQSVTAMRLAALPFEDQARGFLTLPRPLEYRKPLTLRPHQQQALTAWLAAECRGIAALPTGAGKTILAVGAIHRMQVPALVLVPTLDLLSQWVSVLESFFSIPVGMLGGGEHRIEALTVSTYDSATLMMEHIGNRFALLVADECHHLPGPETRLAAEMSIAPWRLGLSATPELSPERELVQQQLLGDVVCRIHIDELEGRVLAPYEVRTESIPLDPDEKTEYRLHRKRYTDFLRANGITFRNDSDWGRFLGLAGRSAVGRAAFASFLVQRRIARCGKAKVRRLWEILVEHAGERTIVFTADNAAAYDLGRWFRLPVLTHRTRVAERKAFLERFRSGEYPVLVTSRVLNEGVDVPAAAVGIVLSGTGSVREHVQRLGRILRPSTGKSSALLYELISAGTCEESTSARRRDHRAYRGRS